MKTKTKTIGVLGGMGPAATVDFYRRLVDSTMARSDQDHLHVLIDSQPAVPDRTAYLLGYGDDPRPLLTDMARHLEQAGADFLVIACNTANAFASDIAAAVQIPVVDWMAEAANAIAASQRTIENVGLLATDGTIGSNLYQHAFGRRGINVLVPAPNTQEHVVAAIYGDQGVKAGTLDLTCARYHVEVAAASLIERGADAIFLACTELSLLYASVPPGWSAPTFDAAQLVAERVILLAGGEVGPLHPGSGSPVRAVAWR